MSKADQKAEPKALVFTGDYDHVEPMRTVAYKKGQAVPTSVREAAIAAGKAIDGGEG